MNNCGPGQLQQQLTLAAETVRVRTLLMRASAELQTLELEGWKEGCRMRGTDAEAEKEAVPV